MLSKPVHLPASALWHTLGGPVLGAGAAAGRRGTTGHSPLRLPLPVAKAQAGAADGAARIHWRSDALQRQG